MSLILCIAIRLSLTGWKIAIFISCAMACAVFTSTFKSLCKAAIKFFIGISPKNKPADVVAYLMAKPKPAEQVILQKVIKHAQEAIEMIVAEGWPKAASIHTSLQTK